MVFSLDYIARAISDYLTSETGVIIIFESAIVPKWRESRISFKNVYVSRRLPENAAKQLRVKGNEHLTAAGYDVSNHPGYHQLNDDEDECTAPVALDEQDTNYSLFDLNIDSVDVTLSLWRWLDGKGLVEDAVVKGVRGVLGACTVPLLISQKFCSLVCRSDECLLGPRQSTEPRVIPA